MAFLRVYPLPLSVLKEALEVRADLVYALLPGHLDLEPFLKGALGFLAPKGHLLLVGEAPTLCRASSLLLGEGLLVYDLVLLSRRPFREALLGGGRLEKNHLQLLVAFREMDPTLAPEEAFPTGLTEREGVLSKREEDLLRLALDLEALTPYPSLQPPLSLLALLLERYAPLPSLVADLGPGAGPMGLLAAALGRDVLIQDEAGRGLEERLKEALRLSPFLGPARAPKAPSSGP